MIVRLHQTLLLPTDPRVQPAGGGCTRLDDLSQSVTAVLLVSRQPSLAGVEIPPVALGAQVDW